MRQPNSQRLTTAATNQQNNATAIDGNDMDNGNLSENDNDNNDNDNNESDSNENDSNDSELPKKRAPRHSKNAGRPPKPDTLLYYPAGWKSMLMKAKEHYRRYIALERAFPDRTLHLNEANLIIAKTRAEFEADGFILEDGWFFFYMITILF